MAPSNSKTTATLSFFMRFPRQALLLLLSVYQLVLSPLLGPRCRFHPTCSNYAKQAIKQHGLIRGCSLTLTRLSKCHPFHQGGVDEVPGNTVGVNTLSDNKEKHKTLRTCTHLYHSKASNKV